MPWEAIILGISGIAGLIASTGILVWFVSSQFSANRNLMWEAISELSDKIITKLEYHEKHDDDRFNQITEKTNDRFKEQSDRIWNIELRNAAKDGTLPREYKKN